MERAVRFLMGTVIKIEARGEWARIAVPAALEEISRIEGLMSRFNPESDVARINDAGNLPIIVSPETYLVVEKAVIISHLSRGAFDITLHSKNGADFRDIHLDKRAYEICLCKPGQVLDLGGIAKGYAVDRAIQVLKEMGVQDALVSAGGDIGVIGRRSPRKGWLVGVQHPRTQKSLLCQLALMNKAVATSGDYYTHRSRGGCKQTHILSPQRGKAAQGALTATVIADQALEADALSTTVFVLGPEDGIELLENLSGVEGLVVGKDEHLRISSGFKPRWNASDAAGVKVKSTFGKYISRRHFLMGALTFLLAVAVNCRGGIIVPATQTITQPNTEVKNVLMDGIYRGESLSGVLVQVKVTVQGGRMIDIQIVEYREISSIHAGKPSDIESGTWQDTKEELMEIIPERIIEKQSASVDAVTGATMSSQTIMAAVEDALSKAVPLTTSGGECFDQSLTPDY